MVISYLDYFVIEGEHMIFFTDKKNVSSTYKIYYHQFTIQYLLKVQQSR